MSPRKFGHKLLYKRGDDKKLGKTMFYYNQVPNKVRDDQKIGKVTLFYNQVPTNNKDDQKIGKASLFYNQVPTNDKDDQKIDKISLFYNQVPINNKDDQKIGKASLFYNQMLTNDKDDQKIGKASLFYNQVPTNDKDDQKIGKATLFYNQVPTNNKDDDQNIGKATLFYNQVPTNDKDNLIGKISLFHNQVPINNKDDQKIGKVSLFYNQVPTNDKDDQKIGKISFFDNQVQNNNGGDEEIGERYKHIHRHEHAHVHLSKAMRDVFFFEDDLVIGSTLTTRIPSTITNLNFLHQDASKHLPFSSKNFPDIINMFGPASLTMADDIAWTLKRCDHSEMVHGEIVGCARSIESFVDLVVSSLGTNNVRAFSSGAPNEGVASVNYTLASFNLLTNSQSILVCHDMPYPYKVFYCHTAAPSRAYQLKLVSDVGLPSMDALVVCHLNTMTWDPKHPFFQVMHVKPGQTTACQFLTRGSIVWVTNAKQGYKPDATQ
ncbi:hypothetical protein GUJ93_ZPchr0006g42049 [Zizania palustris]|uniref:BURP domain-containing protein n=1 Tax=Zizania palustris TaxID=103762 RepID=A0A8J5TG97_ZIZPA|nr:hypothetical protein GUJ93_ZPchr0006g42049 [Zizania palustris]